VRVCVCACAWKGMLTLLGLLLLYRKDKYLYTIDMYRLNITWIFMMNWLCLSICLSPSLDIYRMWLRVFYEWICEHICGSSWDQDQKTPVTDGNEDHWGLHFSRSWRIYAQRNHDLTTSLKGCSDRADRRKRLCMEMARRDVNCQLSSFLLFH
jgi:hypothetical protein